MQLYQELGWRMEQTAVDLEPPTLTAARSMALQVGRSSLTL